MTLCTGGVSSRDTHTIIHPFVDVFMPVPPSIGSVESASHRANSPIIAFDLLFKLNFDFEVHYANYLSYFYNFME